VALPRFNEVNSDGRTLIGKKPGNEEVVSVDALVVEMVMGTLRGVEVPLMNSPGVVPLSTSLELVGSVREEEIVSSENEARKHAAMVETPTCQVTANRIAPGLPVS
jgi:hypothetical protein